MSHRPATGSSARLSYAPPSTRATLSRSSGRSCRSAPCTASKSSGLKRRTSGETSGGKAADAATAIATRVAGCLTEPEAVRPEVRPREPEVRAGREVGGVEHESGPLAGRGEVLERHPAEEHRVEHVGQHVGRRDARDQAERDDRGVERHPGDAHDARRELGSEVRRPAALPGEVRPGAGQQPGRDRPAGDPRDPAQVAEVSHLVDPPEGAQVEQRRPDAAARERQAEGLIGALLGIRASAGSGRQDRCLGRHARLPSSRWGCSMTGGQGRPWDPCSSRNTIAVSARSGDAKML